MVESVETTNPFNVDYPSGEFFVGRERQLKQLHELLKSLLKGTPSNLYVVGKGGEGKTSYLDKIIEEAEDKNMLGVRCNLDLAKPAEANIDTAISALLRELERKTSEKGIEDDWKKGKDSTFRTPQLNEVQSDELAIDFQRIYEMVAKSGFKACVICIDEGQRIHPIALSAFKNSLQAVKTGYMIVLSLLNEPGVTGITEDIDNNTAGRDILNGLASRSGDPGASRFFQNASSLGPFETQKEAADCIMKRLENNIMKFSEPAVKLITHAMGRHPSKMILFCHGIYELASSYRERKVGEEVVQEAFLMQRKEEVRKATEVRENSSNIATKICCELVKAESVVSPVDIAKRMYPNLDKDVLDGFSVSVKAELDRLCSTGFCKQTINGLYQVREPELAYALELCMG